MGLFSSDLLKKCWRNVCKIYESFLYSWYYMEDMAWWEYGTWPL